MPCFEIAEARRYHCGQMARKINACHRSAAAVFGIDHHRELYRCFEDSAFRRAWLIDGNLAALGGVIGTTMSASGFVWLVLSEQAKRYPLAVVKEARRQIDEVMLTYRELATTILPGDEAAKRFAIFLGFHIAHSGPGHRAYSRAGRRTLAHYVDIESACHVPIKDHYVIAMGYHHEVT